MATTTAGTLNSNFADGQVIDGTTLVTGDRILLKNQTNPVENGVYVISNSGAPTRASDLPVYASAAGVFVFVTDGTTNADRGFICYANPGFDMVDVNDILFTQFSGVADQTATAGTGIVVTGNEISINTDVVVTLDGNQTLTNKTINLVNNPILGTIDRFNAALSNGNFCAYTMSEPVTANVELAVINTFYPVNATSSAISITLPPITADNNNTRIIIADVAGSASTYNITIIPNPADTIGSVELATPVMINANYNTLTLVAFYGDNGLTMSKRWVYV